MDIVIKDGFENMDFPAVTELLDKADWVEGIKIDEVLISAENSALVVGAFSGGKQVGYMRAVSDTNRFAYVCDVFVHEDFRHMGIAKAMLERMLKHEKLKAVYRWVLISRANELYKSVGFDTVKNPERWMEINTGRPKQE